jgi:ectoine hydroxylase-related dioxygenase (phytanoyl-CoA dioxygenase family)
MGDRTAGGTVTPEQRDKYDRDGYLILEPVVSEEIVDGIVADLDPLYERPARRLGHAWKTSANVKALALAPTVLSLLEDLYGRKPFPWQTINFWTGSQQAVHSDALHFNTEPRDFACGVWTALEDMDMDNGAIEFYPGSHRLPEITMTDIGLRPTHEDYPQYEAHIRDLIEREGLAPEYATIRKGQSLLWAANMLHGGAKMRDRKRTRHSQVTHYFFEDCRYWVPMFSDGDSVHWIDPEPIA